MLPQNINVVNKSESIPSRTYKIDWDSGRIQGFIDNADAIKQAVFLHLETDRYAWMIHSFSYGSELYNLIGMPTDLAIPEMERMIKDALSVDSRIREVKNFKFKVDKNKVLCRFDVISSDGTENMEIDINV